MKNEAQRHKGNDLGLHGYTSKVNSSKSALISFKSVTRPILIDISHLVCILMMYVFNTNVCFFIGHRSVFQYENNHFMLRSGYLFL